MKRNTFLVLIIISILAGCQKDKLQPEDVITLNAMFMNEFCSSEYLYANDFAVDNLGNLYIGGHFSDVASFGDSTLVSNVTFDMFICKLSPTGSIMWIKSFGDNTSPWIAGNTCYSITTDINNNVYMTGGFIDTLKIENTTLISQGSTDTYIIKLSSEGSLVWAKQAKAWNQDQGQNIQVSGQGDVIISGIFYGPSISFSEQIIYNRLDGGGQEDAFIACYSSEGEVKWVKRLSGGDPYGDDIISDMKVDKNNNIYFTGETSNDALFENVNISLNSLKDRNFFLISLNKEGNVNWINSASHSISSAGKNIAVDNHGNILVNGTFYRNMTIGDTTLVSKYEEGVFLLRYDADGRCNLIKEFSWDFGTSYLSPKIFISNGSKNEIFFSGSFSNSLIVNGQLLSSNGANDFFISKLDYLGNTIFNKVYGGPGSEQMNDFNVISDEIFVLGQFTSSSMNVEEISFNNTCDQNAIVFKLIQ